MQMRKPAIIRLVILTGLLSSISLISLAQRFSVEPILFLPQEVSESSGVIFLNDKIITHNDSCGEPILYEVDPENGSLIRELMVDGASNIDWEDITFDQQHIYIGDIGNNTGNRTDLRIYRITLLNYFQARDNTVLVDTISFSYQDQLSFDPNPQTNFDAEALISFEDSLYIFTKNWGDLHSNIYCLPKSPGEYGARRVGRIDSGGLITGGVYNPLSQEIILTGYTLTEPFLFRLSEFSGNAFDQGESTRLPFDLDGSFQVEGIEAINEMDYYITTEANALGEAMLLQVETDFLVATSNADKPEFRVFPNPASKLLNITGLDPNGMRSIILYNLQGQMVSSIGSFYGFPDRIVKLDLFGIPAGTYQLSIANKDDTRFLRKLILR